MITTTVRTTSVLPRRASTFDQTDVNVTKTTEALKDYEEVANAEGEDERDVEQDDDSQPTSSYESERYMMKAKSGGVNVSLIIKASVIAISTIFLSLVVFLIIYKQYKKSTNPLNYKEKNETGSQKANEEFSEIRYLTSDETLDFNIASPDSVSDLWILISAFHEKTSEAKQKGGSNEFRKEFYPTY